MKRFIPFAIFLTIALEWPLADAVAQETHTVHFPAGATGTTVRGSVKGKGYIDYRLMVSNNQVMRVRLIPESVYFNVLPPGSADEAIFIGSLEGSEFSGTLPLSGNYVIRVYQMGAAADENRTKSFTIQISAE